MLVHLQPDRLPAIVRTTSRRVRLRTHQPASPGKVDAAKAGCGHERGNQEGRTCPPQVTDGGFFMSVTEQQTLAIEALVRRRCDELGLTPPELIRRCGYQNVSKGLAAA